MKINLANSRLFILSFLCFLLLFITSARAILKDLNQGSEGSENDRIIPSGLLNSDSSSHDWEDWSWEASSSTDEDFNVPPYVPEQDDASSDKNTTTTTTNILAPDKLPNGQATLTTVPIGDKN